MGAHAHPRLDGRRSRVARSDAAARPAALPAVSRGRRARLPAARSKLTAAARASGSKGSCARSAPRSSPICASPTGRSASRASSAPRRTALRPTRSRSRAYFSVPDNRRSSCAPPASATPPNGCILLPLTTWLGSLMNLSSVGASQVTPEAFMAGENANPSIEPALRPTMPCRRRTKAVVARLEGMAGAARVVEGDLSFVALLLRRRYRR